MKSACILLLIATVLLLAKNADALCTMTSNGTLVGKVYPTKKNTNPVTLTDESYNLLMATCSNFKGVHQFCCNEDQVNTLAINFKKIDLLLWHCSSCQNNFKKMWCDFTCSPDQQSFVSVSEMQTEPGMEDFIATVKFNVALDWEKEFWDSCKKNKIGSTSISDTYAGSVRNMLQGMVDAQKPTPYITYTYSESDKVGYSADVEGCQDACLCAYCDSACLKGPKPTPDYSCRIFGMGCMNFGYIIMGVVIGLFVVAVASAMLTRAISYLKSRNSQTEEISINARLIK
ncbi:Niemann-Pick type C-related protein [Acrasis kona]|uniref:Niemann-Pick type C-related protein n=1 Tax=Acrasis kona TaxID=1008807 RepID=A0AAW2YNW2_9EUKA